MKKLVFKKKIVFHYGTIVNTIDRNIAIIFIDEKIHTSGMKSTTHFFLQAMEFLETHLILLFAIWTKPFI